MWTHIDLSSLNLARLSLQRSKPLALCLSMTGIPEPPTPPSQNSSAEDSMLCEALQRSRTLSLRLVGADLPSPVVTQPAPLLEALEITTVSTDKSMQNLVIDELFGNGPL